MRWNLEPTEIGELKCSTSYSARSKAVDVKQYPRILGWEVFMYWLTPKEIADLTGYKQYQRQLKALNQMGIDHKRRPDGTLVVSSDCLATRKPKEVRVVIDG